MVNRDEEKTWTEMVNRSELDAPSEEFFFLS